MWHHSIAWGSFWRQKPKDLRYYNRVPKSPYICYKWHHTITWFTSHRYPLISHNQIIWMTNNIIQLNCINITFFVLHQYQPFNVIIDNLSIVDCWAIKPPVISKQTLGLISIPKHKIHETCHSVTFYFMKNSFPDISRKCILPNKMP